MTQNKIKMIHRWYGWCLAAVLAALGILLVLSCLAIYRSGSRPYSAESIALKFRSILIPVMIGLVGVIGGIGLNLTNPLAARQYAQLGVTRQLILPEVKIEDMECIAPDSAATGAMVYGHMPLMLTRACPLHNLHGCDGCTGKGELTDRKAKKFPVRCGLGVRTIYNPIPIYMGDKTEQLPVDWVYAHFTTESRRRCGEVLRMLQRSAAFDGEFTRGLYYKGTA